MRMGPRRRSLMAVLVPPEPGRPGAAPDPPLIHYFPGKFIGSLTFFQREIDPQPSRIAGKVSTIASGSALIWERYEEAQAAPLAAETGAAAQRAESKPTGHPGRSCGFGAIRSG